METRELGSSGIKVSVIGLGCNNFSLFLEQDQVTRCILQALDEGITLLDMASEHVAGKEEAAVGEALGARRKDVVIATKFGQQELMGFEADGRFRMGSDQTRQGTSRRWIMQSVEESLRRLKTDYIDLYQPHVNPPEGGEEEMMIVLDELVRSGTVRAIGHACSFTTAAQLRKMQEIADTNGLTPFVTMQTMYNMLAREADTELLPEAWKQKMSLLPASPLANGLLTGKYRKGDPLPSGSRFGDVAYVRQATPAEHWDKMELLRTFAQARNMSMVELSFAWLLAEPRVASVIAGATRPEQVKQNAATASVRLSKADLREVDKILQASPAKP